MTTVFLPGAGGRRAFWEPVAARLGGPSTLFAWPGFGDAPPDPMIRSLDDLAQWLLARLPAGPLDVVAQSMGGVLAMRVAIEHPDRIRRLVLVATSGGSRVARSGIDWRAGFRAERSEVPDWFERDQTDLDERLVQVRAPTLLVFGDADPIAPAAVGEFLRSRIAHARLLVVRTDSHTFAEEQPDEVARAIADHLGVRTPGAATEAR